MTLIHFPNPTHVYHPPIKHSKLIKHLKLPINISKPMSLHNFLLTEKWRKQILDYFLTIIMKTGKNLSLGKWQKNILYNCCRQYKMTFLRFSYAKTALNNYFVFLNNAIRPLVLSHYLLGTLGLTIVVCDSLKLFAISFWNWGDLFVSGSYDNYVDT